MGIELGVGAKAPAFKLPRDGGGSVALKDFKGRGLDASVQVRFAAADHCP